MIFGKLRFLHGDERPIRSGGSSRGSGISAEGSGVFLRAVLARTFSGTVAQDIEVPPAVLAKWHREAEREPQLRDIFREWSNTGGMCWRFLIYWLSRKEISGFSSVVCVVPSFG